MIKKAIIIIFTLSLLTFLSSCSIDHKDNISNNNSTLEAIIVSNDGTSLSVLSLQEQQYYNILVSDDTLTQNDIITIEYTEVQEIYPLQIKPINVSVSKTQLLSIYLNVIDELMKVDNELGKNAKYLSLDIADELQLSKEHITLIHRILADRYGYEEVMTMNFEELVENGFIEQETMPYFKDGLLISIIAEEGYNEHSLQFSAMKYKAALAAYFFTDCSATNTSTGWEYTIGDHAIS